MDRNDLIRLLEDMSLEEKIGQLVQIPGSFFEDDFIITGPANYINYTGEDLALAGSVLSILGAGKLRAIQKRFMDNHPHHIPLIFMADIINGYRTVFPIPLGQGAMFNPQLSRECAAIAAEESAASGVQLVFSPMADLVRDARWGRVMESTGEDPYLNSVYTKALVEGYQGEGSDNLRAKGRVSACVKHFAAYGAATAGRDYNTVELSDRTFRDEYLPSYKAAVDAGCDSLMTSFNVLNRIPSSGNNYVLRTILREEWGYDGVVISDWAAINELVTHRIAGDEKEAAYLAINAGVDIDMCTRCYCGHLKELVEEGRVDERLIDESVLRVLTLKNKLGLFENPYRDMDEEKEKTFILCDDNRAASRRAAAESFVLLKNDGILPVCNGEKVAFIGPFTDTRELNGSWSIFAGSEDNMTIEEVLRAENLDYVTAKGCRFGADYPLMGMGGADQFDELSPEAEEELLTQAEEAARGADKVILTLGESNHMTGEASSRGFIEIPRIQQRLLRRVAAVNDNIAVVLFTGRPLDIREISDTVKSVLVVWQPGTEGAGAIVDVVTGKISPSGKLPMSFPYCVGQVPVYYNELSTGRPYSAGNDNKFLSKYIDIPNAPAYPFGFGMSYSAFDISEVRLDKSVLSKGDTIKAEVTVKNTGSVKAAEVVQMYIRDEYASVARPVRELKGFTKIELEPGEERAAVFDINEDMLRFTGADDVYRAEEGMFTVYIGNDSTTENEAKFELV